jgi:hypothetical protein
MTATVQLQSYRHAFHGDSAGLTSDRAGSVEFEELEIVSIGQREGRCPMERLSLERTPHHSRELRWHVLKRIG